MWDWIHGHPQKTNQCGHRNETLLWVSIDITRASCLCCLRRRSTYCWQSADKAKLICKSLLERIGGRYVRYHGLHNREQALLYYRAKMMMDACGRKNAETCCVFECASGDWKKLQLQMLLRQAFLTRIRFRDLSLRSIYLPTLLYPSPAFFCFLMRFFSDPFQISDPRRAKSAS